MENLFETEVQVTSNPLNFLITSKEDLAAFCHAHNLSALIKLAGDSEFSVNDILLSLYKDDVINITGHCPTEWGTFKQWKEKGYKIKKGEKAFRVWSRPDTKYTNTDESGKKVYKETYAPQDGDKVLKLWHTACLFHDGQVER